MVKAEGWDSKSGSKWKSIPSQMFCYRAAAFFGRLYCPERLLGMQTAEELQDITKTTPDVTVSSNIMDRFKSIETAGELPITAEEIAEVTPVGDEDKLVKPEKATITPCEFCDNSSGSHQDACPNREQG
jgi:hypothetical protein